MQPIPALPRELGKPLAAPVLIYHGVYRDEREIASSSPSEKRYFLPVSRIEAQLESLAAAGFQGCSLERFRADPPKKPVVLTFDDGHLSNYTEVWPLLRNHGFDATYFAVASWLGREGYIPVSRWRELRAAGIEVGSHGLTHRPLHALDARALREELTSSKRILEDQLGWPVRALALPGGFESPAVIQAALEAGYTSICTSRPGWAVRERAVLPRYSVTAYTSARCLAGIVEHKPFTLLALHARHGLIAKAKSIVGAGGYEWVWGRLTALRHGKP